MIIRVNKTKNYTVMSNRHLQDRELSLKAKGLLSVVLSLPEDWDYSIPGLTAICKENETAVKSTLTELKDHGYLVVTKLLPNETDSGRFEYLYDFFEEPQNNAEQEGKKQGVENLPVENLPLNKNTNKVNTNKINSMQASKKGDSYADILAQVPVIVNDPELYDTFIEFIKMRKLIKAPLTDRALKMVINEAYKLSNGDPVKMRAIVEQSIRNNWKDVYALKDKSVDYARNSATNAPTSGGDIDWDKIIADAEERAKGGDKV